MQNSRSSARPLRSLPAILELRSEHFLTSQILHSYLLFGDEDIVMKPMQ